VKNKETPHTDVPATNNFFFATHQTTVNKLSVKQENSYKNAHTTQKDAGNSLKYILY